MVLMLPPNQLDTILTLQFAVAWAGESGDDDPRLKWWDTDMVSKYGGHALLKELAPRTAEWAALEVAREAARRADETATRRDADPDRLISLFRFGFALDEQLQDRIASHKLSGRTPTQALEKLPERLTTWNADAFADWLASGDKPKVVKEPVGRRLTSGPPQDPCETARRLAQALVPLTASYPCPHYRSASA
ncbi:MAG: BREX-6 system BrxE protein [Nannocystaceae bacterium]